MNLPKKPLEGHGMPEARFLYWDTNVFVAYLNNEAGRALIIESIFDEILKEKNFKITTSTITISEVAWVAQEKLKRTLLPQEEARIDGLWENSALIEFIDFNEEIAYQARTIMRNGMARGLSRLKPLDFIHLASAEWLGAIEINTYDNKFASFTNLINIPIKEPHINQAKLF